MKSKGHMTNPDKQYFMSQRQMRESRFAEDVLNSHIKRGDFEGEGIIGTTAGGSQCGCGCGPVTTVVYCKEEYAPYDRRQVDQSAARSHRREVSFEVRGVTVK